MTVDEIAREVWSYAKRQVTMEVTMEVSMLGGQPGVVCRLTHHCADYPRLLLVPLTEYYKASVQSKHIMEPLPLMMVLEEYDRLLGDAIVLGVIPEKDDSPP